MAQVSKNHDPEIFAKALGNPYWDATMDDEYCSLMVNDIWDLVPFPKGIKLVRCKWVYRTKYASYRSVEILKEKLVSKGFSQVEGVEYNETLFFPLRSYIIGQSIKWMSRLHSYMVIYRRNLHGITSWICS